MRILSILGMILLLLVAVLVAGLLLVLFFPVTYRVRGSVGREPAVEEMPSRKARGFDLSVRVDWLFGLFRVRFRIPEPGRLTVKVLCFSLFDSKIPPDRREDGPPKAASGPRAAACKKAMEPAAGERDAMDTGKPQDIAGADAGPAEEGSADQGGGQDISSKFRKIKDTICGIYDKIKNIWENISYYTELLREEDTRQLAAHVMMRVRKILKSIRPRRVRADILFGTGSPDTTGYLYGAYCVLWSLLGAGFQVTPDFERKVLEGEFDIAGHVTVWILAVNGLKIFLDRRLRVLVGKLKAGTGPVST